MSVRPHRLPTEEIDMTCIVGLKHENSVWIGGDSAGVAGLSVTIRKDPKVFVRDKVPFRNSFDLRIAHGPAAAQ